MRGVLVTGANKGIGLAISAQILLHHVDTHVFLCSRDLQRGLVAAASLAPELQSRCSVLELDVADDASVRAAADVVRSKLGDSKLYGIVNNAGIYCQNNKGGSEALSVNVLGPKRVVEAFLPLLQPDGGRVVFISSAAGPMFVAKASAEAQKTFVDASVSWEAVEQQMAAGLQTAAERPSEDFDFYGLSKACLNCYNHIVARENPKLVVNACTPGMIETDLTATMTAKSGKTPAEWGMKPPEAGARSCLHLLFEPLEGSGLYFGSDAVRSPLNRYRGPGDPPYTGN